MPRGFPSVVGDPAALLSPPNNGGRSSFVAFCTVTLMGHVSDRFGEAAAAMGASPVLLSHSDAAVV